MGLPDSWVWGGIAAVFAYYLFEIRRLLGEILGELRGPRLLREHETRKSIWDDED